MVGCGIAADTGERRTRSRRTMGTMRRGFLTRTLPSIGARIRGRNRCGHDHHDENTANEPRHVHHTTRVHERQSLRGGEVRRLRRHLAKSHHLAKQSHTRRKDCERLRARVSPLRHGLGLTPRAHQPETPWSHLCRRWLTHVRHHPTHRGRPHRQAAPAHAVCQGLLLPRDKWELRVLRPSAPRCLGAFDLVHHVGSACRRDRR
jgi:hypothetical protein